MRVLAWIGGVLVTGAALIFGGIVLAFARGIADDWDNRSDRKRGHR